MERESAVYVILEFVVGLRLRDSILLSGEIVIVGAICRCGGTSIERHFVAMGQYERNNFSKPYNYSKARVNAQSMNVNICK
jgi:hypothetical protein